MKLRAHASQQQRERRKKFKVREAGKEKRNKIALKKGKTVGGRLI